MLLLFREQTSSQSFPDLGIPKMSQKLRPLVLCGLASGAVSAKEDSTDSDRIIGQ
jgi:hypothetical protein